MKTFQSQEEQAKQIQQVRQEIVEGRYSLDGKALEQQNYFVNGVDQGKKMDRETCMEYHKQQHKISYQLLKSIYSNPPTMQVELAMFPSKLADALFTASGIES